MAEGIDLLPDGDVRANRNGSPADLPDLCDNLPQFLDTPGCADHAGARSREGEGNLAAEATACASDDECATLS